MAVVQLRVDGEGRAYSTLQDAAERAEEADADEEVTEAAQEVMGRVINQRATWAAGEGARAPSCTDTLSTVLDDFGDECPHHHAQVITS